MKISARNRIQGRITEIRRGAVNNQVVIDLGDGQQLLAIVTDDACQALERHQQAGSPVLALFKASAVLLVDPDEPWTFSARNQLAGQVICVEKGPANAEVQLRLNNGLLITATVTRKATDENWIQTGARLTALIKASQIILALPRNL